jgi:hypothetical protein
MERGRLTERDLEVLGFCAEQRLVVADHVRVVLGVSDSTARGRLRALTRGGFLVGLQPFAGAAPCYQVRARGLQALASDLGPARRPDLRAYEHEVGVAWLWLSARAGRFGPLRQVVGERRMRSEDARPDRAQARWGVRLGGVGAGGRERLHYPDLLLVTPEGRRAAVELELSSKGRVRREKILAGYGADGRIDAVLYLVRDRRIGRSVQESARRLGLGPLIHVQQVRLAPGHRASGAAQIAERSRASQASVASVAEVAGR